MKVEFYCSIGFANATRKETFDTDSDLGLNDEEWAEMSEDEKDAMVMQWVHERLEFGYREK